MISMKEGTLLFISVQKRSKSNFFKVSKLFPLLHKTEPSERLHSVWQAAAISSLMANFKAAITLGERYFMTSAMTAGCVFANEFFSVTIDESNRWDKSIALPAYKRREGISLSVMSIPQTFRIFEERSSLPPSFSLALPITRVKWRLSNGSRQSRQIKFRGWTFLGVDRPPWIPVNFQNFALSTQPEWRVSSGDFLPTSFPGFSPTHPTKRTRERPTERPWKTLVTWLQNKIISEGGVLCLTFFCLVYSRRSRSDRNSKIDLLTLLQI